MRPVRLFPLVTRCKNKLHLQSKYYIKSLNTHDKYLMDISIKRQGTNRKAMGFNINAIRKLPTDKKFAKYRFQIFNCKSVNQIDKILQSRTDFDITVYATAIKCAAILHNVTYCTKIAAVALNEKKLIPSQIFYGVLFKAFNLNLVPLRSEPYLSEMINIYHIPLNIAIATTLLDGCAKTGNVSRANNIWQMMREYNLEPDGAAYVAMIKTFGQTGDWLQANMYYNEMIHNGIEPNIASQGSMLHALIKNNQINAALDMKADIEKNGAVLTIGSYIPLISYYLRDAQHQNPCQALKLLKECVVGNKLKQLNEPLLNIKHVALLKTLQNTTDARRRKKYFKMIKHAPNEKLAHGLRAWDYQSASVVFGAYMEYYEDYKSVKIRKCFEKLCKLNMMGYWHYDKKNGKWIVDLHGYSYQQIEFVLYYLMNIKCAELVGAMGYEWIFICGKGQSIDPNSKDAQPGIKQFIVGKLLQMFNIQTCDVGNNPGRIILNKHHIKRYVALQLRN